jgi:hypothetical protein
VSDEWMLRKENRDLFVTLKRHTPRARVVIELLPSCYGLRSLDILQMSHSQAMCSRAVVSRSRSSTQCCPNRPTCWAEGAMGGGAAPKDED